jgi:hypothetical protein
VQDRATGKLLERTKIFHEGTQAVNTELPTKENDLSPANNDMDNLLAPCVSWKGKKVGVQGQKKKPLFRKIRSNHDCESSFRDRVLPPAAICF